MSRSEEHLHIIVPCMGRLEFIQKTIESALAQPNVTYTLVDYSCPQKTGEWVRKHYPEAAVVVAENRTLWHASEARNLGSSSVNGGWLCFLDSDIIVSPGFSEMILSHAKPGSYLIPSEAIEHLFGMLVCSKADFERAGGYDENIRGWGWEDNEMRASLERLGLARVVLPDGMMDHIAHDETLRTTQCEFQDRIDSFRINRFYAALKAALIECGGDDPASLARTYSYVKEHYVAGFPWLHALNYENELVSSPKVPHTLASIGRDYKRMDARTWGKIHTYRIESLHREPILELWTAYDRQTVFVRAEGRARIDAMEFSGERLSFPVEEGKAQITLTGEPILLLDGAALIVPDIQVGVAPAAGPALAVDLTFADGFQAKVVELEITIGEQPPIYRELPGESGRSGVRLAVPVALTALAQPQDILVRVTANGITQEILRRTTFLTASKVTEAEAVRLTPPEQVIHFQVGGIQSWVDVIANSYKGLDDLSVDVAWGWTDTALICWIERRDDIWVDGGWDGDGVQVAVQPWNERAHFASRHHFTQYAKDGKSWMEFDKIYADAILKTNVVLIDAITMEDAGRCRRMVIRVPFGILGITPEIGHTLGLSMLFNDNDGEGRKGWLEWGGGIGSGKSPRLYNEITLV